MSETSFKCQSVDSVVVNDLSQNNPNNLMNSEKSESGTKYNLNRNIRVELLDKKRNLKDNFKTDFSSLKSGKKKIISNGNETINCEEDEEDEENGVDARIASNNIENIHNVKVQNFNINNESKESNQTNKLQSLETENEKVLNTYKTEKTDEFIMKAAFSKVAEHFGLSSPEGNPNASHTFYGVYIPSEPNIKSCDEETLHIYTEKAEALKVMKQSKKARLKLFKTKKEALHFVVHGFETPTHVNSLHCPSGIEKVMPFKCPKVQDMISFKKAIENGDVEEVRRKITDNPRYLVSSGDTPSILQEGSRYNALHIAAKSKNAEIVRLILDSITNVEFISHLYDDNDFNSCKERIEVLVDLYLNMPDKGLNETPLHIAVKHGALDVVECLISYPQCQRNLVNKFMQRPKDIICSRVSNSDQSIKDAILSRLEDQYYLPALRYEDNAIQPRVGDIFSPSKPLNLPEDLLSPKIEVQAYAGPMSIENAELFKKKWKAPLWSAKNSNQSSTLKLQDMEKGLERIGRSLAKELKVPWKEYWPFLDTFTDLTTDEGLQLLEQYLGKRFEETIEMVNNGGNAVNSESSEKAASPITSLCEAMRFCSLNDDSATPVKKLKWSSWNFEKYDLHRKSDDNIESDVKNPLLYVERSCEVFGKRMASVITSSSDLYTMQTEYIKDSLEIQIKHLISNILSYREDSRFQYVNFQMIHSRVAAVAVHYLEDYNDRDRAFILNNLKDIDWSDGTLSDDEDVTCNYRNSNQEAIGNSVKQHLHCLVKNLISELNDFKTKYNVVTTTARNEADCARLWAMATPCYCSWGLNTHFRPRVGVKRKSSKYLRNQLESDLRSAFSRVLTEVAENESCKKTLKTDDEEEEVFCTPPSGPSDSEEEIMEDPMDVPDTFIYEGSAPSRSDYAVLDAIETVDLTCEKYPNIYRWKHLMSLHSKSVTSSVDNKRNYDSNSAQKRRNSILTTPNSSPGKVLKKSLGACDISRRRGNFEPWERILGPYSPCTPKKANSLALNSMDSPFKR